jgi:nicotinate phosphoribosyltransferase
LHYLRGTNEYGDRMFCEPYLDFLKDLRMPEYCLEKDGQDLRLEFSGSWPTGILWETIALSIVNELYARRLMKPLTRFEREVVHATGRLRLAEKIKQLREHPSVIFSDFGSRRRFSGEWQAYIDETLRDELPQQFLGSSNTYLAAQNGTVPMGTAAHELFMVVAGLREGQDNWLSSSQREVLDGWWREYSWGLSVFLPDTFGSDFFLRNLTPSDFKEWKGFRWDSGDPIAFGEKIIRLYKEHGIDPVDPKKDPKEHKILIPSDGLDLATIFKLHDHFNGRIKMSYGWGTNLTNDLFDNAWHGDLWYGPLSLVVKPVTANGHRLVKLSDNLAKATGADDDVERYKHAAGYTNTESVECTY